MSVNDMPLSSKVWLSRRGFMGLMLFTGLAAFCPEFVYANIEDMVVKQRSLSLYNPHTKDRFDGIYWCEGQYDPNALEKINLVMRDYRINAVKPIDTHLLDLLADMSLKLQPDKPFQVISGYRTPQTNARLRKRGKGAAKNSYHMQGMAVDIRLPGYKTAVLRQAAYKLKGGGVGYYPHKRFVHVDVGPIRYWNET